MRPTARVVTEIATLVQHPPDMHATRTLLDDILPLLDITWVDERSIDAPPLHSCPPAIAKMSLVDWTSFVLMRELGARDAFAFDEDVERQGSRC